MYRGPRFKTVGLIIYCIKNEQFNVESEQLHNSGHKSSYRKPGEEFENGVTHQVTPVQLHCLPVPLPGNKRRATPR
jgi:hypothetical protein